MTKRYKNKAPRMTDDAYWDEPGGEYEHSGPKKLRRNKIDGVLGGVCSGFGDYFGLDHILARIIFVLSVVFLGFPLLAYLVLWIFIPSDKRAPYRREYREARKARHAHRKAPDMPLMRTSNFRDVKSKFRSLETRLQDLERSITLIPSRPAQFF